MFRLFTSYSTLILFTASVSCGGSGAQAPSGSLPETSTPKASPEVSIASLKDWLEADPQPPKDCPVSHLGFVRPDIATAVDLGAVHAVLGTKEAVMRVNPRDPALKVLWVVDESAGDNVLIGYGETNSAGKLFFSYRQDAAESYGDGLTALPYDQIGTQSLQLQGPFSIQRDAARGIVVPSSPGCYELTAEWKTGAASAFVYVYGSRSECLPPCP